MTKNELIKAFEKPLPGEAARQNLSHSNRLNFSHNSPPKESAVAILLYEKNGELHCLLTQRTENKHDKHSGQISFPGGSKDDSDLNHTETAIRECYEEIGIRICKNDIVGKLSELYIPVSNFNVQPFVAFLNNAPTDFNLQKSEVAEIIEVPISHLLNPENLKEKQLTRNQEQITVPYYDFNSKHIWGATAMMLSELLSLVMNYKL